MLTLIHIPRSNGRFGGNVPLQVNGTLMRIPVGVDYTASDAELAALVSADIIYQRIVVPAGNILISSARYGSRLPISINGVLTFVQTGVAFVPNAGQLAALDGKGIEYVAGQQPTSFDPASLFSAGDDGFAFDMTDLKTMALVKDGSGGSPALNEIAKWVRDLSGKGRHAISATGWTVKQDAGGRFYLNNANNVRFNVSSEAITADASTLAYSGHLTAPSTGGAVGVALLIDKQALFSSISDGKWGTVDASGSNVASQFDGATKAVYMIRSRASGQIDLITNSTIETPASGAYASRGASFVSSATQGLPLNAYRFFAITRALNNAELAQVRTWLAEGAGVSL